MERVVIILTLPYPISANRYWATRVMRVNGRDTPIVYVTSLAKAYRDQVVDLAMAAGVTSPLPGRIAIAVRLFPHRPIDFASRMRKLGDAWSDTVQCIDLDNANKVLLDALKGVAFEDDRWVRRLQAERMEPDAHGARVIVAIQQLVSEQRQCELLEV